MSLKENVVAQFIPLEIGMNKIINTGLQAKPKINSISSPIDLTNSSGIAWMVNMISSIKEI